MNSKKYKLTISLVVVLILLAGGLFVFDNFYLAEQQRANLVNIYVAKDDVQAYTKVTEEMFREISIHQDSVLPVYVTNFEEIKGKELLGAILKNEPLTTVRLTDGKERKDGEFSLKIESDFMGDVKQDDLIRVYVQITDKNTLKNEVKLLFDTKKIRKMTTPDNIILQGQQGIKIANIHINATEAELKDYYIAKSIGTIIVAKYDNLDIEKIKSEDTSKEDKAEESIKPMDLGTEDKFDVNSEIVKNAKEMNNKKDGEGISVMSYVVQEDETTEDLTIKFKTDLRTISELNEGKTEFNAGETITVPAE